MKSLPEKSGFKIPEGYLENFIVDFNRDEKHLPHTVNKSKLIITWSAAASLLLFAGYFITSNKTKDIDTNEIAHYLLDGSDIDITDLTNYDIDLYNEQFYLGDQAIKAFLSEHIDDFNDLLIIE